jgi:hypothetical protein
LAIKQAVCFSPRVQLLLLHSENVDSLLISPLTGLFE